jgi:hypothetical protein
MSEKNKAVEEPTIKFSEDGKEYKVNEMPNVAKEIMLLWDQRRKVRDDYIAQANNNIQDMNYLLSAFETLLKNLLEPEDSPKIEVPN